MVGQQLVLGQEDAEPGGQLLGLQGPSGCRCRQLELDQVLAVPVGQLLGLQSAGGLGDEQEGGQGPGVAGREDLHDEQQADDEQEGIRGLLVFSS